MKLKIDDRMVAHGWFSDVCTHCKNLEDGVERKCKAFKEIPLKIWYAENDHKKPYPGDNGIQFEPIKEGE
jgi:hypothetical protein